MLQGVPAYPAEDVKKYKKLKLWWDINMGDGLDRMAKIFPYRTFVVDETKKLAYDEVNDHATRLAYGFLELGFKPGDRVIMHMPNVVEFCTIFFALQRIGVIPILGVPRHGAKELAYFGKISDAVAWIGPSTFRKTNYLEMLPEVRAQVPSLKHVVVVDEENEKHGHVSYRKVLASASGGPEGKYRAESLRKYRPDPDEVATLIPTGGTTGLPKLVPLTHNVYLCKSYFSATTHDRSSRDSNMVVTPLAHDAGMVRLLFRLCVGGRLVLSNSTKPKDILAMIQKEKVTHIFLVPTLIIDLIHEPDLEKYDTSSLVSIASGGAFFAPELNREARNKMKCNIANNIGMAEGIYIGPRIDYPVEEIINTVGKPHCPWNSIRILDDEERDVPPGQEGELAGKGPSVFSGYYKDEESNKKCFTKSGYYRTGDLARTNAMGNYIITGRKKDLINRGGEKVNAEQVEEMVMTMEGILDVSVVAMPDARLGEKICAYVKPKKGYSVSLDKVTAYMKSQGASVLLLPERIEIIEEIPLTAIGKADKKVLRQMIADKIARESAKS